MANHTPTPWYADDFDIFDSKGVVCKRPIVAENAVNWPANAAFIVKAANNYEALVKAIRDIKQATIDGRVCADVAWFDTITTLHDFCDQVLAGDVGGPCNG